MGRLSHEKGFDLLLEAFAQVHLQCPDWRLRIVGDGPDMEALRKLARQRIPSHAVVFNGRIADPQPLLDNAQLFVLSSRYEGFPNVLLEAMAAGCACIATDCQSGPADMITTGVSGLLVPPNRVETLAAGMLQLIGAPAVREQYGLAASRGVERFAIDGVVRQWDAVLATATTERAA